MSQQRPAAGLAAEEPLWSSDSGTDRRAAADGDEQLQPIFAAARVGGDGAGAISSRDAAAAASASARAPPPPRGEEEREGGAVNVRVAGGGDGEESRGQGEQTLPPAEQSIQNLVDAAVISLYGKCENLPVLRPHELKMIGRCVTFLGETIINGERQMLHYEGLVGMLNKDTVMLLHTSRYTSEDFLKLKEQRMREDEENLLKNKERTAKKSTAGENDMECAANKASLPAAQHGEADDDDINCFVPAAFEGRENTAPSGASPENMYGLHQTHELTAGSMPPVPYMTFSRRRIHKVGFGREPRASFYSLFRDSSRRHFDMQCLRMFVRRYLVHTAQGNNPRGVSFRPFIACRCNCKDIDNELLMSVAKEELAVLAKTERDIVRSSERAAQSRRNAFQAYEAPSGLFSATGILFLTKIPMQTFCLAVVELLVSILFISFMAFTFAGASPQLIASYVRSYVFYTTLAVSMSVVASVVTALHSLRMRLPHTFTTVSVLRFVAVTASIGLNIMMVITAGEAASLSSIHDYLISLSSDPMQLCTYYIMYNCSGLLERCNPTVPSPLCPWTHCAINPNDTCTHQLSTSLTRIFVPLVVLSMVLVALFFIDHFMHYRLLHISRILMAQM